jgi:polynucleotide 5'-triphosphatase
VYNDVARRVCDFIWTQAVNNELVRNAIAESEHTQLEIEARWGHIVDRPSNRRLRGYHDSETVVKPGVVETKFESTMTLEQHKRMNMYLNAQVAESRNPAAARAKIDYQHTKEVDIFYELGSEERKMLPEMVRRLMEQTGTKQRIRVTRDQKTNRTFSCIYLFQSRMLTLPQRSSEP